MLLTEALGLATVLGIEGIGSAPFFPAPPLGQEGGLLPHPPKPPHASSGLLGVYTQGRKTCCFLLHTEAIHPALRKLKCPSSPQSPRAFTTGFTIDFWLLWGFPPNKGCFLAVFVTPGCPEPGSQETLRECLVSEWDDNVFLTHTCIHECVYIYLFIHSWHISFHGAIIIS